MKKILALALVAVMVIGMMSVTAMADGKTQINLWSFSKELADDMMPKFLEANPDLAAKYEINSTMINNDGEAYTTAIDAALMNGEVDIYAAEAAYVYKYTQGAASPYAAPYADLGIDVDAALAAAEIAQYTVDIGTRPADNALVALGYQATGGAFIYRRSIAKAVLGSDDPAVVEEAIGAGSGNWDKFFETAAKMKDAGYKMVSGKGDVWNVIEKAAPTGWVVDGKLNIDPVRMEYMDVAKTLLENEYMNDTAAWGEAWFADMTGPSNVFGFYGPAWLINFTLGEHCGEGDDSSFGDWAVCSPNVGFFWGGTWVLAGQGALAPEKVEFVKAFIEWVTLDASETGLQYQWANGTLKEGEGTKDTVASSVVMAKSNGESEFLGGQNMFDTFVPATVYASGKAMTEFDSVINSAWDDQVGQYAAGLKDLDSAIMDFKMALDGVVDIEIEY